MNCFNHQDQEALGICKCCGKAVCGQCVIELKAHYALACSEVCATQLRAQAYVGSTDLAVLPKQRKQKPFTHPYLLLGFGLLLLANGVFNFFLIRSNYSFSAFLIGILFFVTASLAIFYREIKSLVLP